MDVQVVKQRMEVESRFSVGDLIRGVDVRNCPVEVFDSIRDLHTVPKQSTQYGLVVSYDDSKRVWKMMDRFCYDRKLEILRFIELYREIRAI